MIKGKKAGKSFKEIGKRWYDFDFELERTIYCYLCCSREKKRKIRKLDEKLKFESYQEWKKYVKNKYDNFSKDMLVEFSRYLNQRIRNTLPGHEYWIIVATVSLTMAFTEIIDVVLSKLMEFSGMSMIIAILLSSIFIVLPMIFIMVQTFYPLFDNNIDENLLKDYKEIIDEIVKENTTLQLWG